MDKLICFWLNSIHDIRILIMNDYTCWIYFIFMDLSYYMDLFHYMDFILIDLIIIIMVCLVILMFSNTDDDRNSNSLEITVKVENSIKFIIKDYYYYLYYYFDFFLSNKKDIHITAF